MQDLIRDLRHGFRRLLRTPGFTAAAVLTLGLGIGANTAIFTFVNRMLLRPLPVKDPQEIVALSNANGEGRMFPVFSYLNYRDLRDRNAAVADLLAYAPMPISLSHDGVSERVWSYLVSGNYFDVLGLRASAGRLISSADDARPGAHPVTVISHDLWRRRFGGDPTAIGRSVIVNGQSFEIIGVGPPGFVGIEVAFTAEMWFPTMMQSAIRPGSSWQLQRRNENLYVAARLRPGVTAASARAAFRSSAAELEREFPIENEGKTIELSPAGLFGSMGRGPMIGVSGILLAAATMVLLLVCTNLANLMLARGIQRRREIAIQQGLGATRWRIVRQLLTECLLLSLAGGATGLALAYWISAVASRFRLPIDIPVSMRFDLDWRVLVYAIVVSILAGAAFGSLPAWQCSSSEAAASSSRRPRLRRLLVGAQVSLSFVLMICAGLTVRSLQRAEFVDMGVNPDNAVEIGFDLTLQGYSPDRGRVFLRQLLERVRSLPGMEAAGAANVVPPDPHIGFATVRIAGMPDTSARNAPRAGLIVISPGFREAMGTTLVRGRDFDEDDTDLSPPVAIVNETFVRQFLPDENGLGNRLTLSESMDSWIEIVGVVRDGKYRSLGENPAPVIFLPIFQRYTGLMKLAARTSPGMNNPLGDIRREIQRLDPHLPVFDAQTLTEHMRLPLFPARVAAMMFGGFGSLALVIATVGIFGIVSFTVNSRTREVGIRIALGAERRDILKLMLFQEMIPVAAGLIVGLLITLVLMPVIEIEAVLFGVSSTDPLTFVGVALLLALVALCASYLPARRALAVDPLAALRHD